MAKKKIKVTKDLTITIPENFTVMQQLFIAYYVDPLSPTFGNGLQSAIKAGFTPMYAKNLMANRPLWLCEIVGKLNLVKKAKENLEDDLNLEVRRTRIMKDEDGEPIEVFSGYHGQALINRQNATFFVLEKLHGDFRKSEKGGGEGGMGGGNTFNGTVEMHYHAPSESAEKQPEDNTIHVEAQEVPAKKKKKEAFKPNQIEALKEQINKTVKDATARSKNQN